MLESVQSPASHPSAHWCQHLSAAATATHCHISRQLIHSVQHTRIHTITTACACIQWLVHTSARKNGTAVAENVNWYVKKFDIWWNQKAYWSLFQCTVYYTCTGIESAETKPSIIDRFLSCHLHCKTMNVGLVQCACLHPSCRWYSLHPSTKGWPGWVAGYLTKLFTSLATITRPRTNRAGRRATSSTESDALPTKPNHHLLRKFNYLYSLQFDVLHQCEWVS